MDLLASYEKPLIVIGVCLFCSFFVTRQYYRGVAKTRKLSLLDGLVGFLVFNGTAFLGEQFIFRFVYKSLYLRLDGHPAEYFGVLVLFLFSVLINPILWFLWFHKTRKNFHIEDRDTNRWQHM